jgi:thiol-disulfide isomerase/thioredoxin
MKGLSRVVLLILLITGAAGTVAAAGSASARIDDVVSPVDAAGLRKLLDARRGQIVVLNFWATWCRPCLEEIPVLQTLASEGEGLELLPVSLDEPGSAATVEVFIEQWFPGFRSWLSQERDMDTLVSVVDAAWNEVLPTTYVIDRSGQVTARLQGGKSAEEFAAAVSLVRASGP